MKLVAIFISVMTLVYLVYSFVGGLQYEKIAVQETSSLTLISPVYISDTPLLVEQVWQQLKDDRIKAKQPVEKKKDNSIKNKDVLTIGDNKYALYGIFNGSNKVGSNKVGSNKVGSQTFILIKALANKDKSAEIFMQKIITGEELSEGITLVAVTSNSISFKQNDALIEFNLFEAKH